MSLRTLLARYAFVMSPYDPEKAEFIVLCCYIMQSSDRFSWTSGSIRDRELFNQFNLPFAPEWTTVINHQNNTYAMSHVLEKLRTSLSLHSAIKYRTVISNEAQKDAGKFWYSSNVIHLILYMTFRLLSVNRTERAPNKVDWVSWNYKRDVSMGSVTQLGTWNTGCN